jgi:hypothetical protein
MVNDPKPIACSLGAGDLNDRLAAMAEVGANGLISRERDGDRHLLRFGADPGLLARLEEIVAAEQDCCSFLDLSLTEGPGGLLLSIGSSGDGQVIADELAAAFG